MKIKLIAIIVFSLSFRNSFAQIEKTATQVGISVLPILDVLKFFPENEIYGFAVAGNLGYLTINKLSIGIQPYYSKVSNSYSSTWYGGSVKEHQQIQLYGLNTYLRYYFVSKEKFLTYAQGSAGFGNFEQKTSYASSLTYIKNSHTNKAVFTALFGVGASYFVSKNFAIELNVPYIYVNQISTNPYDKDFHSIAPTIGFQFYWK